jgi:ubiquinone/menaquinone biosynthesis C-methylase UbiE
MARRPWAGLVPAFFRGVQDTWWYRDFLSTLLPPLADLKSGARALDFGAGPGRLVGQIRSAFPALQCVGADCDPAMLKEAAKRFPPGAVELQLVPRMPPLPFRENSFDAVCAASVLHVIPDPEPVVGDLFRILRPGGVLLVATPAHHLAGPVVSVDPRFHLWRAATLRAGRRWDSERLLERSSARHGAGYDRFVDIEHRSLVEACWLA